MNSTIIMETFPVEINITTGYLIGAVIAVFILGYLVYALIKPEKF